MVQIRSPYEGRHTRRAGFTIVELLVAAAVTIFIMVILASAFQAGLDTFRNLKAAGDMQERLRTATVLLRSDMTSWHFPVGGASAQYLNAQDLNNAPDSINPPPATPWRPPPDGF